MSAEASAAAGFAIAGAVALIATPVAIAVARRTDFYDRPRDYRKHAAPTPFLGGAGLLLAFLITAFALGNLNGRLLVLAACAVGMWLLGTLDDLVDVPPKWRLLAATGAGVALYLSGFGWNTGAMAPIDVLLTVLWTVVLVNAFNLMDNLDGACGTVAATAATGIGALALIRGHAAIAGLAFALAGACAGFLPWNLAGPAKIFLGDGGSMPLGFLVAALAMATARHTQNGHAGVLVGALFVGLPMLDTTLVSLSRWRRGVTLLTGGRDHLTHRILLALGSSRSVAVVLAVAQGFLCSLAIAGYEGGPIALAVLALIAFLTGVVVILVLDTARWRPTGIAMGEQPLTVEPTTPTVSLEVERFTI